MSTAELIDVLIVGGGPAGACAGALLARAGGGGVRALTVALLEPKRPALPTSKEGLDSRVVAMSRASERILGNAGAWSRMTRSVLTSGGADGSRLCAYERMCVWHESVPPGDPRALRFDAAEVGEPNLGYIVENRLLQSALLDAFVEAGGTLESGQVTALRIESDRVNVETTQGPVSARLIIGADGAQSAVRQLVGLTAQGSEYGETALVANVSTVRPHARTAWQRFMRDGTLAFLPLADGNSSIVWSADDALAKTLVAMSPEAFATELDRASDLALGATRLLSERASFPLRRMAAQRYVAQRCALIGDAAHVVHPLAGQGVNLGLLDAAALAEVIAEGRAEKEDPGALRVLRKYERWRKSEVAFIGGAIDAFDRYLAHGSGSLAGLAQRGMGWVNKSAELKKFFVRRALGVSGELPRAAR